MDAEKLRKATELSEKMEKLKEIEKSIEKQQLVITKNTARETWHVSTSDFHGQVGRKSVMVMFTLELAEIRDHLFKLENEFKAL